MNHCIRSNHEDGQPGAPVLMVFLWVALIILPGCSPNLDKASSFKTLFDYFRQQEYVTAISFPPGLVGVFLNGSDPEQAELKALMHDLSAFYMLSVEGSHGGGGGPSAELREAVNGFTIRNQFEDLFRMQTAEEDVFIRILEKNGSVKEAVMMFGSDDSFFVIDLRGNIELEHFTHLAQEGLLQELTGLADVDF